MSVIFSDNFNGISDGQLLTNYSANWITPAWTTATPLGISNRIYSGGTSVSAGAAAITANTMPVADYEVSADVTVVSAANSTSVAVLGRWDQTAESGYRLIFTRASATTANLTLSRVAAGSAVTIGTAVTGLAAPVGSTTKIRLRMVGSTISAFINEDTTPLITGTNTTYTAAGRAGVRITGVTNFYHADNFVVDDLISGPSRVGNNRVFSYNLLNTVSRNLTFDYLIESASRVAVNYNFSYSLYQKTSSNLTYTYTVSGASTGVRLRPSIKMERGDVDANRTGIRWAVFSDVNLTSVIASGNNLSFDTQGRPTIDLTNSSYQVGDWAPLLLTHFNSALDPWQREVRTFFGFAICEAIA